MDNTAVTTRTPLSADGWFGLGLGLLSLYSAVMVFLSVPQQMGIRPALVGLFAAAALGGLGWGLYRLMTQIGGRSRVVGLGLVVGALLVSVLLSWGMAFVFNHWGSTLVFDQASGDLIGYAPSPADGGFDGTHYEPLDIPASDAPGVPS